MNLQNIKVSQCYESETNPRGAKFDAAIFKELVASVKEKGVLVPVLVRARKHGTAEYEVIAGSRRLRAAKEAGLKEIPAQVVEMNDTEAREAQIVENLQRQDIHPVEEGAAYRVLVVNGADVKDVALRVGKSETYVRDRLFLTNLVPAATKAFRNGAIVDGVAVLIAKLSEKDQPKALEYATDEWDRPSVADMKQWIEREFYSPMERQPWLKSKDFMATHTHAKSCQPESVALFADMSGAKAGACTDLECWKAHMDAWIAFRREAVEGMIAITDSYGHPLTKGTLTNGKWQAATGKKNECKLSVKAIFAEGAQIGKETEVCANADCKKHWGQRKPLGVHKLSDEEKAQRAKQKEEEAASKAKDEKQLLDAVAKVKFPISEKHLDALLKVILDGEAINSDSVKVITERLALEREEDDYASDLLEKAAKKMSSTEKIRLVFELLLRDHMYGIDYEDTLKSL